MFRVSCQCGNVVDCAESRINQSSACPRCGSEITCISAEPLAEGSGSGDFDAALVVVAGPAHVGRLLAIGGCLDIGIGKQTGNHIVLAGPLVSRCHCKLVRIDFGPSRWMLQDNGSTNGLFVNYQRITRQELKDGDAIQIGDYELKYRIMEAAPAPVEPAEGDLFDSEGELELAPAAPTQHVCAAPSAIIHSPDAMGAAVPDHGASGATGPLSAGVGPNGPRCPSCDRALAARAKICVDCGIYVKSGRPLIVSEAVDANAVYENIRAALWIVSWIIWVTPLPIPLASSAYGKFKPYAIWSIAAVTILASLCFFFACWSNPDTPARAMMLWPQHADYTAAADKLLAKYERSHRGGSERYRSHRDDTDVPQDPAGREEVRYQIVENLRDSTHSFHPWQLLTCALLHDPGSILGFAVHLGGNMLFLFVFGSRVNAIIGNVATAIVYPILAIASAGFYLLSLPPEHIGPMLGASGAINGLAGMYLVLFPAHHVYCAMWLRLRLHCAFKVFPLRGFWLLLIYFAWDALMVTINSGDGTAHAAHIGGFLSGMVIGLALLMSRLFDCRNGDLLSVLFGKHAWPLVGRPASRAVAAVP